VDSFADQWALARIIDLLQHAGAEPRLVVALAADAEVRERVEAELRRTGRIELLHQPTDAQAVVPPALMRHQGTHYNNLLYVVDGVDEAVAAGGDAYLAALDRATPLLSRIGTWVWFWTGDPVTYRRLAFGAPELWSRRVAAPVFFSDALLEPSSGSGSASASVSGLGAGASATVSAVVRDAVERLDGDDVDGAAARLDEALGEKGERVADLPELEQAALWALRGTARLRGGELVAARDAFRRLKDLAGQVPALGHARLHGSVAEVLLAAGEPRRARELGMRVEHRALGLAAEIELCLGDPAAAVARLCEAVRTARASGHPGAAGRALVRLAETLGRLGAPEDGARVAARAVAEAAGTPAHWTRVEALRVRVWCLRRAGEAGAAAGCLADLRAAAGAPASAPLRVRALMALGAAEADAAQGEEGARRAADAFRAAVRAADGGEGGGAPGEEATVPAPASLHHRVEARIEAAAALRAAGSTAEATLLAEQAVRLAAGARRYWLAARAALERGLVARAQVEQAAERDDDAALGAALAAATAAFNDAGHDAAAETAFVEVCRARVLRADAAFWEGAEADALRLLDSAVDLAGARGLALWRFEALELRMAALAQTGKASRAFADLVEMERLAAGVGYPDLTARADLRRGDHFARLDLAADATQHYARAADVARRAGDAATLAAAEAAPARLRA
jgi:hypothetical protein